MSNLGIYDASLDGPLRQGEILSDIVQICLELRGLNEFPGPQGPIPVRRLVHPLAVIASQDCDLDWDFRNRFPEIQAAQQSAEASKALPCVLLFELNTAEEIRNVPTMNRSIWKQIQINKNERYQFLESVPPESDALNVGLPELAIDFKRYFSISTGELYLQLTAQAKRRCRLTSTYAEHLSHRAFYFQSRIALPADHFSEPGEN